MKIETIDFIKKSYNEIELQQNQKELKKFTKYVFDGILSGKYAIWNKEIETIVNDYLGIDRPTKKDYFDCTISASISHKTFEEIQEDKELRYNISEIIRNRLNEIIQAG